MLVSKAVQAIGGWGCVWPSRLSGANCTYSVTGKAFRYDCRACNRLSNRVSNIVIACLHKEPHCFLQRTMCLHGLPRLSGANCTYPVTGKAFLYDCRTYNRLSNRVSNIVIAHLHKEFCYFLQPAMCLHELPRLSGHLFGSGPRLSMRLLHVQ